jgi:hypothetical protein
LGTLHHLSAHAAPNQHLGIGHLGAALLLPIVPAVVAGAGLVGFAGGLLGLYLRTPGMHQGLRPTQQGTPIAKDVWLLGIGAALVLDEVLADKSDAK